MYHSTFASFGPTKRDKAHKSAYVGFPQGYFLTTKPHIDAICSFYIKARLGDKNNSIRENPRLSGIDLN